MSFPLPGMVTPPLPPWPQPAVRSRVSGLGFRRFSVKTLKYGDALQFVPNFPGGHAGNRRFRVQQNRHLPPKGCGGEERFFRFRQRNSRPVLTNAVRVLGRDRRVNSQWPSVKPDQFGGCLIGVWIGQTEGRKINARCRGEVGGDSWGIE